jgi:hypothetical protein
MTKLKKISNINRLCMVFLGLSKQVMGPRAENPIWGRGVARGVGVNFLRKI